MATLSLHILNAARHDNFIPLRLSPAQMLYLESSVSTANQIYWAIADSDGLDSDQLQSRLGLNKNTLAQYCRWLEDSGLIVNLTPEKRSNLWVKTETLSPPQSYRDKTAPPR